MYYLKFRRLFTSIIFVVILLAGCSGNVEDTTPTFTVASPTAVIVEASATPVHTANPGAPGIGDSLYPNFGNGGYDVQHYTLDLTVNDVRTSDLDGMTTIEAVATQNLSSFNLDFIGFEITDIKVNGQPAHFRRRGQELTITPNAPLAQNESFTIEVRYQGSPGAIRSVAPPIQGGWTTFEGGSFVFGEPEGAATFYPVNDHPLDKASYVFRVTVAEPYEVAANGVLNEALDNGETTTFVFEDQDPMASYLVTINIGEFDIETSEAENGVPIRNYFPAGKSEEVSKFFARQDEMIEYFSERFGHYPFDVYGAVVIDAEFGAALETQTLSIFSIAIADSNDLEDAEQVIAHELAHQWFGDSVSLADWRDIWLNESFATYAHAMWIEHTRGRETLDAWVREVYGLVREHQQSLLPPGEPTADNLFNGSVYYWGALCLHSLRLEVGDETFFEILKQYHEQYKGGNATTSDFIAVAEEVSGRELNPFFDSWLYSDKLAPIPALGLGVK